MDLRLLRYFVAVAEEPHDGLVPIASLTNLMQVIPAHDVTAYDGIPQLSARPSVLGQLDTRLRRTPSRAEVSRI